MAEQEELRLTVNLADNASAGLQKLNEEIKQLGSGAGQQQIEEFKRETGEITAKVKGMSARPRPPFAKCTP
jgi:poly(3-hydroxyalkanoate) synthetase